MINIRPAEQRGRTKLDWLDSAHSFSFGSYSDPEHMAFRSLRVINDDHVSPGAGFGKHPHRDMEILTYVLDGELEHRDSTGHGAVIKHGELQLMSAGVGIEHSEYNASSEQPVHLLQIWITPDKRGHQPRYAQQSFALEGQKGELQLLASPDGRLGSLQINQDALVYTVLLDSGGQRLVHEMSPQRYAWLQVARGTVQLNDLTLKQGDGAAIDNTEELVIVAEQQAELLLFDLA